MERQRQVQVSAEWQKYDDWVMQLPPGASFRGQWPEESSQEFIDLHQRLTISERMYGLIGNYPPIEEVRTRLVEEVQQRDREELSGIEQQPLGVSAKQFVEGRFAHLNDREREVLELVTGRDGIFRTQKEVASTIGLSERSVRRIKKNALTKLRQAPTPNPFFT